jgi:cbb3-type cytochrome oxidase maturation protein
MNIIFLTLGVSIAIAVIFLAAFIWATGRGQYDDLETPSHRILLDDYESENTNPRPKEGTDK